MKPGKLFGGTGGPLWAFAGIEALRHCAPGVAEFSLMAAMAKPAGDRRAKFSGLSSDAGLIAHRKRGRWARTDHRLMADGALAGMAVMRLSGLALPMGTKVWRRRFRADPNAVSQ